MRRYLNREDDIKIKVYDVTCTVQEVMPYTVAAASCLKFILGMIMLHERCFI